MKDITGFLFATKIEAKPFITGLHLQAIEKKPFEIYNNNQYYLIISGIGKSNAAIAVSYIIWKYHIPGIFNIGAAGAAAMDKKIGEIYHINKVIEYDRPKILTKRLRIYKPDTLKKFKTASLATQDKPVIATSDRLELSRYADLVDMEGAAVIYACRLWDAKCYLFKIISDTPKHKEIDIIKNVYNTANTMFEFFISDVLK